MTETKFTGSYNGLDYEVTQEFICGSKITGAKSEYINKLIIKEGENTVLDTFWKGKESEAYLKIKASEEVSWFFENRDIFTFDHKKCEHRIPANWSNHSNEKVTSRNCLRLEIIPMSDRCSLKMPEHWTDAMKERAHIDILNGNIFDFGFCNGKCPRGC